MLASFYFVSKTTADPSSRAD